MLQAGQNVLTVKALGNYQKLMLLTWTSALTAEQDWTVNDMAELLANITCLVWLALAVIVSVRARQWDKAFREMYDELKSQIEEME